MKPCSCKSAASIQGRLLHETLRYYRRTYNITYRAQEHARLCVRTGESHPVQTFCPENGCEWGGGEVITASTSVPTFTIHVLCRPLVIFSMTIGHLFFSFKN